MQRVPSRWQGGDDRHRGPTERARARDLVLSLTSPEQDRPSDEDHKHIAWYELSQKRNRPSNGLQAKSLPIAILSAPLDAEARMTFGLRLAWLIIPSFIFESSARADEIQVGTPLVCDTQQLVERFVTLYDGDAIAAVKMVNARGARLERVRAGHGGVHGRARTCNGQSQGRDISDHSDPRRRHF